ncbi:hypothetical protein BN2905_07600 [Achromobacter xylosoxidans]|uniref:conjugal transfer protein TraH n=1 Tax=Alcaligenes xylosoxydans xylosoxydans TaxID=85698 RepID=UPI0012A8ED30|nr:conjugal transfer protein TraH [Achromobacter xylosoxidans]UMW89072.1 Protein TraH [Achromobacter xylosoxidans]CUR71494.1 hypothetical protein BN2905_07600 [Achromobacter xylosoxidans]
MSEPKDQSIEDELDAALAALDSGPLPTSTLPEPQPSPEQATAGQQPAEATAPTPAFTPPTSTGSPTLDALEENRRPKASTVCEHCPNSVWFASPAEVKCYCRVMFLVTWSSKEPNQITLRRGISRPGTGVGQTPPASSLLTSTSPSARRSA